MLVGVVDIAQYEMSTLTATFCATPELVQIMCRYGLWTWSPRDPGTGKNCL